MDFNCAGIPSYELFAKKHHINAYDLVAPHKHYTLKDQKSLEHPVCP